MRDVDTFVEQIIAKKKGGKEYAIIFGSIFGVLVVLALIFLFVPFLQFLFLFLVLGAGYGLWWLITSQNVEYEYSVTNGDIDIDQIIAQRKRKRVVSVSGAKIETFAPYVAAEHASRHYDRTVMAATSPAAEGLWCFTYRSKKNGHTLVIFQPERRVLMALRNGLPKLIQLDLDKKLKQMRDLYPEPTETAQNDAADSDDGQE